MSRPIVLSNGQMFVGIDNHGLVHDFYYPYVGLENLTTARSTQHKIGIWVEGQFSWTDSPGWEITTVMVADALIGEVRMHNRDLGIIVQTTDFVDVEHNALIRRMRVTNDRDNDREIRLFMHQVFQISRSGRADTALYVPDDHYLLDYKGRVCLLIAGKMHEDEDFDQFAIGSYGIEGKAGTFKDAEDGELSGNPVEHGGVDSVIRFRSLTPPRGTFGADYWIVASDSQTNAQVVHTKLKYYPIEQRLQKARTYWQDWLNQTKGETWNTIDSTGQRETVQRGALIIKAHCDVRGSILASGDSGIFNYGRDYYCYCWPRDAAFAVWPLLRLGHIEEARKFFDFARDTRHHDGFLMHKFQPDRAIGSTWHPLLHGRHKELAIQEDETAIMVYMLGEYFRVSNDSAGVQSYYDTLLAPCANFMANYIDSATGLPHASYDLWEQKFLTTTYTVCAVIAALETASDIASKLERPADSVTWQQAADNIRKGLDLLYHPSGYFRKGFLLQETGDLAYDHTLDISSFYGAFLFARLPLDDYRLASTLEQVEKRLLNTSPIGGVIRYEGDKYFLSKRQYKGNPWAICTLWLAQYYLAAKRDDEAKALLDWVLARRAESGALSEQFDPDTGDAVGVVPLVWSHADLLNTVLDTAKVA